jgi:hypothetical protein
MGLAQQTQVVTMRRRCNLQADLPTAAHWLSTPRGLSCEECEHECSKTVAHFGSPAGSDAVVLRYFNCRGRGQALRYLLVDYGIEFVDERFEADLSWSTFKGAAQGGPFGSLPVLHWGEHTVGQALAIAGYLA